MNSTQTKLRRTLHLGELNFKFLPSYLYTFDLKKRRPTPPSDKNLKKNLKKTRLKDKDRMETNLQFPRCRQPGYPDLRQLQGDVYGSGRVAGAQAELLQTAVHM